MISFPQYKFLLKRKNKKLKTSHAIINIIKFRLSTT